MGYVYTPWAEAEPVGRLVDALDFEAGIITREPPDSTWALLPPGQEPPPLWWPWIEWKGIDGPPTGDPNLGPSTPQPGITWVRGRFKLLP